MAWSIFARLRTLDPPTAASTGLSTHVHEAVDGPDGDPDDDRAGDGGTADVDPSPGAGRTGSR